MSPHTDFMPERAPLVEHDTSERLSADDMASLAEAQFLQTAKLAREAAAAKAPKGVPGVCTNCGAACLPRAVYCDADCQQDHTHRTRVQARQGVSR